MEKFSKPEFELCANLLYNKINQCDLENILPHLKKIINKCSDCKNDTIINQVFKIYILTTNIDNVYSALSYSKDINKRDDIVEIIVFKQSNDVDINLLAKVIYRKYGKFYSDFLDWQIERLILNNDFDMLQEYVNYKVALGKDEFIIPKMITNNIV